MPRAKNEEMLGKSHEASLLSKSLAQARGCQCASFVECLAKKVESILFTTLYLQQIWLSPKTNVHGIPTEVLARESDLMIELIFRKRQTLSSSFS